MTGWSSKPEWPKETITYPATSEFPPIKFDGMVTVDLDKDGNIAEAGKQAIIKNINQSIRRERWESVEEFQQKVYNNLSPTHDPYTNPNAQLYYQCKCGAILDPGTKSFAALNNAASEKGWKVRFSDAGYVPYCVECGKGVE